MNNQQFTAQQSRLQSLLDMADRDSIMQNKPLTEYTFEEMKRVKLSFPNVFCSKEEREGNYMIFQGRKYSFRQ